MKNCVQCSVGFVVTDQDRQFYRKMDVPEPTLCPACREQRRLAFRNERRLYKRTCSGTGKAIVSVYTQEAPFPVYDHDYFFSDRWDALAYGRDFDFSRPFFDQFHELLQKMPHVVNYAVHNENAQYGNLSSWNKDCYMLFESDNNRDCYYADHSYRNQNVVDCSHTTESELCYGCSDVLKGYRLFFCFNSSHCADSWFLENCVGCKNCFMCANLVNKEYCFFNEQLSADEYRKKVDALALNSHEAIRKSWRNFLGWIQKFPHKYMHGVQNEDCSGDYLNHCKNAQRCFNGSNLRDCRFLTNCERMTDAYDCYGYGGLEGAERVLECHSVGRGSYNVVFGNMVYQNLIDARYCDNCIHSKSLFGCVSMQHKEHCILNKQYSKEDYFNLKSQIIDHMQKTGEWGQFFPVQLSPFAYNETVAADDYPMSKEEVTARGWKWIEYESKVIAEKTIPAARLPETVKEIPDDVLNWAIVCETTGKPFKITAQELKFYRDHELPIPRLHPDERFNRRMAVRNPRKLYSRVCARCSAPLKTTYSPARPEIVYCEQCYLKEVY